jgi:hypothetical protein
MASKLAHGDNYFEFAEGADATTGQPLDPAATSVTFEVADSDETPIPGVPGSPFTAEWVAQDSVFRVVLPQEAVLVLRRKRQYTLLCHVDAGPGLRRTFMESVSRE